MPYRGGVEFEDEGRERVVQKPKNGLLFRVIKKLHLAETDTGASLWVFGILVIMVIIWVRVLIYAPRTVTLDTSRPGMAAEQLIEYNKLQPFDYEAEIKRLQ